ncbi:uncharacterized protein LOC131247786 [Magnolia sinica]|uniref:uncharacterized protein LOC131247786 n=1 Tax=Magnolia sinica TaxID=86752 RepID=UPI0026587702|nr:uncharacterized protein LOC131247786 [Magnolia sinica]
MEETEPPFTPTIMSEVMPQRFLIPPIIQYSGSGDPSEHVKAYRSWMQIQTTMDAMMCHGFSINLTGSARSWYMQLKPNSVGSFAELSRLFFTQFISGKKSWKQTTHLFTIKQGPKESLKDFIAHFNEEALQVEDYDDQMVLSAMFSELKEWKFTFSIGKNPPKMLVELVTRAQKYTNAGELSNSCKNIQVAEPSTKGKRLRNEEPQSSNKKSNDYVPCDRRPSRKPEADVEPRDKRKYCRFHHDHSHNTSDCVDLKDEIETLIRKGHLRRYTEEKSAQREEQLSKTVEEPVKIRTIFGGSSSGGDSNRARKAHSRKSDPEHYVHMTERLKKELRVSSCSLTFTKDDACGIQYSHDNTLLVAMTIVNHKVYRILVDIGTWLISSTQRPSKEWGFQGHASDQ